MLAFLLDDAGVLQRHAGVGRVVWHVQHRFTRMRRTIADIRIAYACGIREIETMDEACGDRLTRN